MTVVARFEVHHTQYLDPQGRALRPVPEFARDPRALVPAYGAMVLMRALDSKAIAMQRTGQMGTYASTLGKEAIDAGVGAVLARDDVVLPSYRESGILFLRGVSPHRLFLYWGGDERGNVFPESPRDFPFCVPIAMQMPHAVGVAYAMKLHREPRVALAVLGDGATSKGDFYEALNAAGVWNLPLVTLVVNNQYAISMPRSRQSAAETLAQKGIAAGIACEQLDGNDAIAVRDARERKFPPDALRGATISLSNYGAIAGRYASPIVVPPAVAILGAGRLERRAVVTADGLIAAHRVLPLSLTFDHRAASGGEAGRFLNAVIADLARAD